jgi:hypothetical protein
MRSFLGISFLLFFFSCGSSQQQENEQEQEEIEHDTVIQIAEIEFEPNYPEDLKSIWDSVLFIADWFKQGAEESKKLDIVPNDFTKFYDQFISDSIVQQESIDFTGFLGVIGECDTTIRIHNNSWEYNKWDFREFFRQKEGWDDRIYWTEYKFYYEFDLTEVGIIYRRGFLKIDGIWKMVFEEVNAC